MKNTFSKLILASAIVTAAGFTSIPAMAATEGKATINVPFSFTVHGKSLPPGEYQVRWDASGSFVTIQSSTAVETFLWKPDGTPNSDRRVTMRFEEHGPRYALQSIQYDEMSTPRLSEKTRKNEDDGLVHVSSGQ